MNDTEDCRRFIVKGRGNWFIKIGVSDITKALLPVMFALYECQEIYKKHNRPLVITSLEEGTHKLGSLHYVGLAVDLRIRHLPNPREVYNDIKEVLADIDERYQVILKNTHIHIEYDRRLNEYNRRANNV